jgi:hypothetical protein
MIQISLQKEIGFKKALCEYNVSPIAYTGTCIDLRLQCLTYVCKRLLNAVCMLQNINLSTSLARLYYFKLRFG